MVSFPVTYRGVVKVVPVVLAAVVVSAVAGCGNSGSSSSVANSPAPVKTSACPSPAPTSPPASAALTKLLRSVPFGLPMPDNITPVDTQKTSEGIQVVKFTTPSSLRDAVIFMVEKYPKAGYVVGRGDAEATEADAPFVKGNLRGLTRVASLQTCQTLWLIASIPTKTGGGGTSPLLSPHPTSSQTSALPFG
jgi:predicted small lipoprotein YifL